MPGLPIFFDRPGGNKAGYGACHDPDEKETVAYKFLNPPGDHAGEHHAGRHKTGAERVMGSAVFAGAEEHHEIGQGSESEAVTELFYGDTPGDQQKAGGLGDREVEVDEVGDVHGCRHPPQTAVQPVASHDDAAGNASEDEGCDADRAVDAAYLCGGEPEPSDGGAVQQERGGDLYQLRLGKTIEEDECHCRTDPRLGEKGTEGAEEFFHSCLDTGSSRDSAFVSGRAGQNEMVVDKQQYEECRQQVESDRPRLGYGLARRQGGGIMYFQYSGDHDEESLSGDDGKAVESVADTDEIGLFFFLQSQHIETVGGDVVGGGAESQQPQTGEAIADRMRPGEAERHAAESRTDDDLHDDDPPSFGFQKVYQRAPQGFDHPREVQPAGVKSDVGVGHA